FTQLWHAIEQQEPSFNLISLLQQGEATKDMVNDPMTYLGNIALLIVGGNDTTRNSMSGSVLLMNEFPDQFEKARDNEKLIPNLVSEVVRMQTPLAHMRRTAKEDTVLNGQQIKKGDKVVMWYLSANRDEDKIENPNQFIIDRPNVRQHLSFGFGVHRCMGNRLAEMQLQILWEEIYKRFSKIEIVGEVKRTGSNFVHGYEKMPVILSAK
ncbi:MAG: cytochrome P450, partial [Pseudomonadota bacterium]|nr:cytochrome P450 [Pseudomonadota bacterium]